MVASSYNQRYNNDNRAPAKSADAFTQARTVSLYQYVEDVSIGTGRDQNGEIYEMRIPIAIDLYFSPEFGGVNSKYTMADWKSTEKEIIYRGWHYQGKTYARATKDGRDFADYMNDCLKTIEISVNEHFNPAPPQIDTITKVVAPWWAWLTLLTTVIMIVLLVLSVRQ